MASSNLMEEFPPVSTQAWEELIRKDLKGADYAKKLIWQTEEGLAVKPYYRAEDIAGLDYLGAGPGAFPYVRGTRSTGDWRIREEIPATELQTANHAACLAIAAGAEEIAFQDAAVRDASDLDALLANLQGIPVHFQHCDETLVRLLQKPAVFSPISADLDPLKRLDFAAEIIRSASPKLIPFAVHGHDFEELGANTLQEVGFALAAGIDYLAEMQARKGDVNRAAAALSFSFAIGSNYFFQIAKLRAFRLLWARAVESFGGTREAAKARIDARTSRWNKTIYDPHVNVLRATTEAMSAAIGGADSIVVAPFDECYKEPDEASRRLARNTQILLKHEAALSRVADPGGGAYYVEVLTDFFAREGWKLMQDIEAAGGYRKAKADGQISRALDASRAAKEKAVLLRRRVFIGTTQNPNLSEKALGRVDESRVSRVHRGAEIYERLRLRTERHVARGGKLPRLLLAEIGDSRMRAARSNFAANFFGCAGFELVTRCYETVDQIATPDFDAVVLCSSDPEYSALTAGLMKHQSGQQRGVPVIIAGYPDSAEALKAAGVADFIYVKANPIEFLTRWQQHFGIKD
jgi:methylmalonyl-CoA mutase